MYSDKPFLENQNFRVAVGIFFLSLENPAFLLLVMYLPAITLDFVALTDTMINELERIWKELVVSLSDVLSRH